MEFAHKIVIGSDRKTYDLTETVMEITDIARRTESYEENDCEIWEVPFITEHDGFDGKLIYLFPDSVCNYDHTERIAEPEALPWDNLDYIVRIDWN